ncbi:MAG: SPASM domain-containing protein [Acidobacteriota bacterium]|nr:SPASM domain-containing protein [Acidobacteriota bacterium]
MSVLCREPWEHFYILRRGILPCCYGGAVIAPMADYAAAWNSAEMQEIRLYLSRGELSPYCLNSPGCPIVQRVQARRAAGLASPAGIPPGRKGTLGALRRLFLGHPDARSRAGKKR